MRVFLVIIVLLIGGAVGGFFYLVQQAEKGAPTPSLQEIEVDVDLSN